MEVYAIELLQDLWKELIVIHVLLQVLCTFTAIDLVYLLIYRLYGLNELTQGRLKPHPSEESQLCLCIALIPEVRKPFDGGEDRLLLPLRSHFGNESFIVLVDLQGEIDRADKILHRLLLDIGIEQIVPLIQRNSIVDSLFELEGIINLLLPRPHEIDQPPEMPLTNRMLIEPLRLHRSVPLDPVRFNRLQLMLFEEPQRLFQHIIITQSLQLFPSWIIICCMEVQEIKTVHVVYVCGNRKCGKESKLKPNDAVKCTDCGYRILYKKRTIDPKEPIQYEAI